MKSIWPDFPSFSISFKEQKDFDVAIKTPEAKKNVDISWSERIINFENEQDREDLISELAIHGISEDSFNLNDD